MNVQTTVFSCPNCGLPLNGLGLDCACTIGAGLPGEETIAAEDEVRFAPVEEEPVHHFDEFRAETPSSANLGTEEEEAAVDTNPDLDTTIVRTPNKTTPSFATVVDAGYMTQVVAVQQRTGPSRVFAGFLRSAALVAMAAFVGGMTVYFFQPPAGSGTPAPQQLREAPQKTVNDISSSGPFINRAEQDAPLVPVENSPAAARDGRQAPQKHTTTAMTERANGNQESGTSLAPAETANAEAKEAKVGAYVAENPAAARKPTARCADGTYSFAASKDAACAGRGGVSDPNASDKTPTRNAAYVLGPRGGCYYVDSSGKKNYVEKKYCN